MSDFYKKIPVYNCQDKEWLAPWPGKNFGDYEWLCRHADDRHRPSDAQLTLIADVLYTYKKLIFATKKEREHIIKNLRKSHD